MPLKKPRPGFEWQSSTVIVCDTNIQKFAELAAQPYPIPQAMPRYLSFELSEDDAEKSLFTDYTLGSSPILPYYFGNLAPVNIFLGENNSGKSRFMREIMKMHPTRILDVKSSPSESLSKVKKIQSLIADPTIPRFYRMDVGITSTLSVNEDFAKIISENLQRAESNIELNIKPEQTFVDLQNLIGNRFLGIGTYKGLLDFVTKSQDDNGLSELIEIIASINRAEKLYRALINSKSYGLEPSSYSSTGVEFVGRSCALKIYAGSDSDNFRSMEFRRQYADTTSGFLNTIVDSCQNLLHSLLLLSKVVARTVIRSYIPILRTARTLLDKDYKRLELTNNILKHTTLKDYGLIDSKVEIITGFELYNDIRRKYTARREGRAELQKFEMFLSTAFFNNQPVFIVPHQPDENDGREGNILITVGSEERDIHLLGDGIQAIILLLYPLFVAPKKAWFFIEEPETHLHPGFQRLFIKTIATHEFLFQKELTIFITTHSNHILDFAIDEAKHINLFTFRKTQAEPDKVAYQIQLTQPGDLESLNVLGVQNSSVFLSNCTIWLEGITDRIYLAAYLKAYMAQAKSKFSLIEGLHYSYLEYAGSNVMHYDFEAHAHDSSITPQALHDIQALSISNRIMLIADQDGGGKTKRDARLSGQQHAGFEYEILEVREIENLLSKEVIVAALQKMYSKQTFDAGLLDATDYKNEYLGAYLRGKYPSLPDNFAPTEGSGTIGSTKKRIFAERAAEAITSWDDMTPEAQQLAEKVYQFIVGHNPRLTSH